MIVFLAMASALIIGVATASLVAYLFGECIRGFGDREFENE